MKSGKLADYLLSTSELLRWAESPRAVDSVNQFCTVLAKDRKLELMTVFALSQDEQSRPSEGELTLKRLLESIARMQKASGATSAAKAVMSLNESIANDISMEQSTSNVESFDLVSSFVRRLNDSSGSRENFEKVMGLFEAKGVVSKSQACLIAQRYAGGPKPKTFDEAVSVIRSKFSSEQLFASKTA